MPKENEQLALSGFPQKGYLYMVRGPRKYFEEAIQSAWSLRMKDPEAHVTLITDLQSVDRVSDTAWDHVVVADNEGNEVDWKEGLGFKVENMYRHTPYEKTFFVDTDTYFVESCRCLFDLLDYFDLCISQSNHDLTQPIINGKRLRGVDSYNTGVIVFRKSDTVDRLYSNWIGAWLEHRSTYPQDQPAFMQALASSPSVKTYVLRNNWNARTPFADTYCGKVMLVHGRHNDIQRVAECINVSMKERFWVPRAEVCVYPGMGGAEFRRLVAMFGRRAYRALTGKPKLKYNDL